MTQKPGRLFCFGMPKCGTTTVAELLNAHPAICLHNQKEPGDFLAEKPNSSLAGYNQTVDTHWLADFTTTYGLSGQRDRFFAGLRISAIKPGSARYVLCLRDPADLACSYLRHIMERRSAAAAADTNAVRAEILSACDFEGAIACLERQAGRDAVFVIRFEDLADVAAQQRLAGALHDWLGIEPQEDTAPVWINAKGSARRYPAVLDRIAGVLRQTDLVRRMSPKARTYIKQDRKSVV